MDITDGLIDMINSQKVKHEMPKIEICVVPHDFDEIMALGEEPLKVLKNWRLIELTGNEIEIELEFYDPSKVS